MEFVSLMLTLLVVGLLYFTPTFVASKRNHRNLGPIAVVNILLGWSLIGWAVALAWSLSSNVESCSQ